MSFRWMEQHERLEKLNMQAHLNAQSKHDEFVVDAFLASDKVGDSVEGMGMGMGISEYPRGIYRHLSWFTIFLSSNVGKKKCFLC